MRRLSNVARLVQNGRSATTSTTSYVTDIEGSLDHWNSFLDISKVVSRDPVTKKITFRDSATPTFFVFGGDAFDKGVGDLTIAEDLTAFKKSFPDRVFLIMGNRDVNKLKLTSDLSPALLAIENPPRPYYLPSRIKIPSLPEFLEAEREAAWAQDKHGASARLRYLLKYTMGSAEAFELRREELAMRSKKEVSSVSDDEVVSSYLDNLKPGGILYEYLKAVQIIARVGETVFVHGSINNDALGFVPDFDSVEERRYGKEGEHPPSERAPGRNVLREGGSFKEWMEQLNGYKDRGFAAWEANPYYNEKELAQGKFIRGGGQLLSYGHMAAMGHQTVTVTTFVDAHGAKSLSFTDLDTVAMLNQSGVTRIATGHQPCGDTPSIVSQPGLQLVLGDNSYCDHKAQRPPNGRAGAISEVLFVEDDEAPPVIRIHGRRAAPTDASPVETVDFDIPETEAFIGHRFSADVLHKELKLPDLEDVESKPEGYRVYWGKARREVTNGSREVLVQRTWDNFFNTEYLWVKEEILEKARTGWQAVGKGEIKSSLTTEGLVNPAMAHTERHSLFKAKTRPAHKKPAHL